MKSLQDKTIERLSETLVSKLNLNSDYSIKFIQNLNSKTGSIKISKNELAHGSVLDVVKDFFDKEGYTIDQTLNHINITKEEDNYLVTVIKRENFYDIIINSLYGFAPKTLK
jgi:hypothetical protein